jgi:hypothetical protein
MSGLNAASDLGALKRRFTALVAFEGVAAVLAVASLIGYFAGHLSACLPAFCAVLVAAVAAQIWFIAAFRKVSGLGPNPARRDVGKGL